jgi:tetratricopeptide (TPR) repeat protein
MPNRWIRYGLHLTATMLLASSLSGCGQTQTHDENVADAENRWKQVRAKVMLDTAQTQFETGQLEMCQRTLDDALSFDPTNPELLTLYGRLKIEQGQLERGFHIFQAAIDSDENAPEPRYYQGVVLQRWQQHDKAYGRYRQAFEREPDNASYLTAMAEMLVALDRPAEALDLLEGKLVYFDQNAGLRSSIGHIYLMTGDAEGAAEMFRQASQLDPDNLKTREDLALAQERCGRDHEAINTLRRLLEDPAMAERDDLRRKLAGAYQRTGQLSEARQIYFDLTRKPEAEVSDWVRLGELAWKQNDEGAALHAANRITRLAPDRHEGYVMAGLIWQKRGRLDDALSMYDRAAELAPKNAAPLILRGIALQKAGRLEAAADAYTDALKRKPDDARALRLLRSVADALN